jgi:hypothetical protein
MVHPDNTLNMKESINTQAPTIDVCISSRKEALGLRKKETVVFYLMALSVGEIT